MACFEFAMVTGVVDKRHFGAHIAWLDIGTEAYVR